MKVKSESEVSQSCPTLSDPMDCSLPGSSVHGIFQAGVLDWGAIAFSDTVAEKKPILTPCCNCFFNLHFVTFVIIIYRMAHSRELCPSA